MPAKVPYKVMIIDDHTIMRDGIHALIAAHSDFDVVNTSSNNDSVMRQFGRLDPNIVLMDVMLPRSGGIPTIRRIKDRRPVAKVVVLTFNHEEKFIHAALEAGADAYVLKDDSRTELFMALAHVVKGNRYLSPSISDTVIAGFLASWQGKPTEPTWTKLTEREREVMIFIAEGRRTRDMADQLSLSPKTIEKHRTNLMKKLDLHSVSAVTAYVYQNGFIERRRK